MFLKHLKEIEENNSDLLDDFREELKKEDYDNYYGTRFEIDIAASLLRKGISFNHPDPPDFVINTGDGETIIECTTSHLSGGDRTIEEKLNQSLISHSDRPYFNSNMGLFIDITNLMYHAVNDGVEFTGDLVKGWTKECIKNFDLGMGSVLIYVYIVDRSGNTPGIGHHYWRLDTDTAEDTLTDFLDEFYPYSSSSISDPYHPHDP
jgi:hypothetical protein